MAIFNGFIIPDYFIAGVIPILKDHPNDQIEQELKLCADCIEVIAVSLCIKLPPCVFIMVEMVSRHLGMDKFDPPLPATVEGFVEYARGAGIVFEESMAKRKII